jgi:hypothetical protein
MSNLEHRRSVFRKAVAADNVLSSRFRKRERAIAGMCGRASIANGHSVTGLTRTPAKAVLLQKLGATPVVANALDQRAIHAAVTPRVPT